MQFAALLLAAVAMLSRATASPLSSNAGKLQNRASSDSPTGGYAPGRVACPSTPLLRLAQNISTLEANWLSGRKTVTKPALVDFLKQVNMTGFNVTQFTDSYQPVIGTAFSGGGYRAMLNGAGVFSAFDKRTPNSTQPGGLGGLLQSSTYLTGLSGGGWLVSSVVVNNFTTIFQLRDSGDVWDFTNSILNPEGILHITDTINYYEAMQNEVQSKQNASFPITLTDYWGRALSRQFLEWEDGGPGVTFSSIATSDVFTKYEMPFPILIADSREPGEKIIDINATLFEFNPYEMGSWDKDVAEFVQLKYLGTKMTDGKPDVENECVAGFDNAGFVFGTSSSLFNTLILNLPSSGPSAVLLNIAQAVLTNLSTSETDIALYSPNPFYSGNTGTVYTRDRNLTLVDGGEDLQNMPLEPLLRADRKVDVIFAIDSSADTSNWPNATAMVATYDRFRQPSITTETISGLGAISGFQAFPWTPDQTTFVNLGMNQHPAFFGCNESNQTTSSQKSSPLVVYIPNAPYTYFSNTSTFQLSYSNEERNSMIQNGWDVATRGNGTADKEWAACVGCAIVKRRIERTGGKYTAQCQRCFDRYCWSGARNETFVNGTSGYQPPLLIRSKAVAGRGYELQLPTMVTVFTVLFWTLSS